MNESVVFRMDLWGNMQTYNYVGLLVGFLSILYAYTIKFSLNKLLKLPSTRIESLKTGLVKVSGQVEAINLLTSPLTGRACVYYSIQIMGRRIRRPSFLRDQPHSILDLTAPPTSFWLNDGSGKILLTPQDASLDLSLYTTSFSKTGEEIRLNYKEKIKQISLHLDFAMDLHLDDFYDTYEYFFVEDIIVDRQALYAFGQAIKSDTTKESTFTLGTDKKAMNFFISDRSHEKFLSYRQSMSNYLLIFGIIACVVSYLLKFGVY